jgi:UPF0176 protein
MSDNFPYNKLNRELAEKKLAEENYKRTTLSFYRYVQIANPQDLREKLFHAWEKLGVLGRVYLAPEGVNAQISLPEHNLNSFKSQLYEIAYFSNVPFKIAVEEAGSSFYKLTIKVKKQIVADGLNPSDYDVTNVGKHLTSEQWNEAINNGAIVVDMRNHYESEIGHFKNAILPDSETFREELPMVKELLKDKKEEEILLYCTGGIRCEKASAYLKSEGFNSVNQLHGGIINYVHEVKEKGLENKFLGKNFVFDDRLAERVSPDIISNCHQCGNAFDTHTNCKNLQCNLLFIQCEDCKIKHHNCCSPECMEVVSLPEEEQKKLRAGKENKKMFHSHKKVDLKSKFI